MILPSASPVSWLLALAAALAYAAPAAAASRLGAAASRNALLVAWVLHGALLVWGLWGEAPRFGFAPALSMTAWLVLTVYAVERQLFPQMRARWMLAALGAATIVLALLFPGQPLHVKASAWLPLHLALGIACYGLFAAAVVHAWLMTRAERHIRQAEDPDSGIPLLTLERLTFRFVTAGFVLLSATLLAGWLAHGLAIVVDTAGESTEETDVLELVRDSWRQIGINIFPKPSQREVFRNRIFAGDTIMAV